MAIAATLSMGAHAQMNYNDANVMSDAAGRIGSSVGYEAGRNSSMGGDLGRLLGVGASTIAKVIGGQQINGADVGGTIGQVGGAIIGYNTAGGSNASPIGKTVGILAGGAGGAILGGFIGRSVDQRSAQRDMDARNADSGAIPTNAQDQQAFLQGMKAAAAKQTNSGMNRASYQQINYQPGQQISPQQAGFDGFLGQTFNASRLPLIASGNNQMPENAMVAVAGKAMEVVKVGKDYNQATTAWDNAFMVGQTPAVKTNIHMAVVNTNDLLQTKVREYTQSRNAAAAQGYDVSLMDGSIAQQLPNLKQQTNYNFAVNYRPVNRPN